MAEERAWALTSVGISKVPDDRLDRLTAMYNPRKRVPATVEFADLAGVARAGAGAQALVDVAAYKNADALVHVVRAPRVGPGGLVLRQRDGDVRLGHRPHADQQGVLRRRPPRHRHPAPRPPGGCAAGVPAASRSGSGGATTSGS